MICSNLLNIPKKIKFGYYSVGNLEFLSKLEAIQQDNKTKEGIKWHFNDATFSSYDWTKEPEETLQELYGQRALRIRKNYDYVVLWYSGGADSHNVLMSFLQNKIHIDEIAVVNYGEADNKRNLGYWTDEVKITALIDINQLRKELPDTLIRYVDITRDLPLIYQGENRWNWIYEQNCSLSPNNYFRSFTRESDAHYKKIIDSGKSMVFIWGSDKPRLTYKDNRYGIYFQDLIDSCVSTRTQILDRAWEHDELFYWSPDSVKILIKQAHTLIKFLRTAPLNHPDLVKLKGNSTGSDTGIITRNNETYQLTRLGQSSIIYPWWPRHRFQQPKTFLASYVLTPRDGWFYRDNHNETTKLAKDAFFNGLEKIYSIVGDGWLNKKAKIKPKNYWFDTNLLDKFRTSSGIIGCLSKTYWLES